FSSKNVKYVYDDKQWDKLKEVRGETAFRMLTELINSDDYKADTTTDAARAEMISRVWTYANNVGRKAVFPEYQMDNLGDDAVGSIVHDSNVTVCLTDALQYLDNGDLASYSNMVEAIRFEMGDDKAANSKIKDKIGNAYRDKYKAAYRKNDTDEMDRIKEILDNSEFNFKISDWEKAVDKED
ncbi:MAG: hypothetical protein J6U12_02395, partial [Candidatus Methanomethylophilaceae archaeon]|nr:hypothetical protein [Candidatus Methanomethylophilaceae archaeon]